MAVGYEEEFIYRGGIRFLIMMGTTIGFIFPLCMFKTLSGFRYLSLFTIFSVIFVIISLGIELPAYINTYFSYENLNFFTLDWNFF